MSPKEALIIAVKREEGAYRFYQALAASSRRVRSRLSWRRWPEWSSHKEKVEYLYDNAAFPEVW